MPGPSFESGPQGPKRPEQPKWEAPSQSADPAALEKNRQERALKNAGLVAAGKITETAIHWGLRGGDMTKNDIDEIQKTIGQLEVADKQAFMAKVFANIEGLPENNPSLKRQKELSRVLARRIMSEMFVDLGEDDEDLPAVTGQAL